MHNITSLADDIHTVTKPSQKSAKVATVSRFVVIIFIEYLVLILSL